jgi:hypothetical protein
MSIEFNTKTFKHDDLPLAEVMLSLPVKQISIFEEE